MRTTIDSAGRIVVPKALRDAMQLSAGQLVDIGYHDGRLQIEVVAAEAVLTDHGFPVLVAGQEQPALSTTAVRDVLEQARR